MFTVMAGVQPHGSVGFWKPFGWGYTQDQFFYDIIFFKKYIILCIESIMSVFIYTFFELVYSPMGLYSGGGYTQEGAILQPLQYISNSVRDIGSFFI